LPPSFSSGRFNAIVAIVDTGRKRMCESCTAHTNDTMALFADNSSINILFVYY